MVKAWVLVHKCKLVGLKEEIKVRITRKHRSKDYLEALTEIINFPKIKLRRSSTLELSKP